MNTNLEDLPIAEKVRLVEDLWDSIASNQESLPLTQEQRIELDRRLAAYDADGDIGRPVREAITDIRSQL